MKSDVVLSGSLSARSTLHIPRDKWEDFDSQVKRYPPAGHSRSDGIERTAEAIEGTESGAHGRDALTGTVAIRHSSTQ